MKKLILAAAIAASPMVMSSEVVNPQKLTEKQEAWLDEHRKGHRAFGRDWDNHGVLGSIFWIRVDDKYYSTRLKNLRTKQDREGFVAQIEAAEIAEHKVVIDYVNKSLEINKIEKDMDAIEKQIKVSKEIVKLQEKIVSLQETLEIVGNDHDKLAAKLQAEIDELKDDISDLEEELETAKGELGEANATIAIRNGSITELETKVSGLESDLETAKEELNEAKATIAVRDDNISELEAKVSGLEKDLETAKNELDKAKATIVEQNGTITAQETKVTSLESELATAKEDLEEANATIGVSNETINDLETKVSGLESDLETTKKDLVEANDTIEEQNGTINGLKDDISVLEDEQAEIKETVKPYLENDENLDLESLSVKEQVQMTIELNTNLITHLETELNTTKEAKKEAEKAKTEAEAALDQAKIDISDLEEALGNYASAQEAYDKGVESGKASGIALVENEFVGTLYVDATGKISSDDYEGLADEVNNYVTNNFGDMKALKDAKDAALKTLKSKLEDLNITVSGYTDPTVDASATGSHSWVNNINGKQYLGSISVKDNNGKYKTYNFDGDPADDTWYQINLGELSAISDISDAEINTILAVAEAAYKHGYEDGYNDGYKEGYKDGYSDGFTDGVNSVK